MRGVAGVLTIFLAACSAAGEVTTTGSSSTTPTTVAATTTSTSPLITCPAAPYELTHLPEDVDGSGTIDLESLEPDVWTSVGGSRTSFFIRDDGSVAIALIRGTLPAVDWPGDKGEVSIDGTRAAVGPHPDGIWVVGWYEAPAERCDLYTMVFYPPWEPSDVQQVLLGMDRVGG
jgi:hypothetical protein